MTIMNFRRLTAALLQVILMLFLADVADAQVTVEISKDKVIVAGRQYYIHTVKKGETAYSIAKAYGITVEELTEENPPVIYGVKTGQVLQIPVVERKPEQPASDQISIRVNKDESKYIYHKLNPGETVYSLSRKYSVSENEILDSNPGMDINKLSIGTEIAIPRKGFMSEKQKFDSQEVTYSYHKVVKGESLSDIAAKYGLSVRELRRANRGMIFPRVNDFIRIPGQALVEKGITDTTKVDSLVIKVEEMSLKIERPAGFTPVEHLTDTLNVAVMLPLYLEENSKRTTIDSSSYVRGKKIYKVRQKDDGWIYPWSVSFVEMYEGILLAADTLRSLGLNVNLSVWDIKQDTIALTRLILSGALDDMDLIIGPVYSNNLALIAPFANERKIPVVSPVPLINNRVLTDNPYLFMAHPSVEVAQDQLAKKTSEYYDHNIVFIHTDTSRNDPEIRRFRDKIFEELSYRLPYETIRFKELVFYNRSKFDNDSINRLGHALSDQMKNLVIIASDEDAVMSETITEVHNLSRKYDVKVLGYPEMRTIQNLDPRYYFELGIMLYTPYWIDFSSKDIIRFNSRFLEKFYTQPQEISFAWQGYDIAYYFLSGLAIHKKFFIDYPQVHNPDLLETEYDFRRKSQTDGFENKKLYLIRYTSDMEIELIKN
jgi:LysM repeat protein